MARCSGDRTLDASAERAGARALELDGRLLPKKVGQRKKQVTSGVVGVPVRHSKSRRPSDRPRSSTTLADLLTLLFLADPGSAVRTSLRT